MYDILEDGTVHINDRIGPEVTGNDYGYENVWPFEKGPHQWTPDTHKFFGWLDKDASMNMTAAEFFGQELKLTLTEAGKATEPYVVNIPQKAMTKDTPQFDFLYSDIFTTEPRMEPVPLQFSHLFSAFCITALNRDDANAVRVKEITLSGLDGTKSAKIDFSGESTSVTYTDVTGSTSFSFTYAGELLSTTAKTMSDKYMIWPQTADDFEDATLYIKYDYTSDGQTKEQIRTIPISSIEEWKAGVVNSINIAIDVDQITFYINSLEEWNTEEKDIIVGM